MEFSPKDKTCLHPKNNQTDLLHFSINCPLFDIALSTYLIFAAPKIICIYHTSKPRAKFWATLTSWVCDSFRVIHRICSRWKIITGVSNYLLCDLWLGQWKMWNIGVMSKYGLEGILPHNYTLKLQAPHKHETLSTKVKQFEVNMMWNSSGCNQFLFAGLVMFSNVLPHLLITPVHISHQLHPKK